MKESIGYTVTLNIVIVFITIIVAFFWFAVIYFRSNKASNIITTAIEKYEGYNSIAINEINSRLNALGYSSHSINCAPEVFVTASNGGSEKTTCPITTIEEGRGKFGYCVYECYEADSYGEYDYYYFKIRTNMMIAIPIAGDILDFPIYSNTNRLYNFKKR